MVDLETLGTSADAVIVSIGAVTFDPLRHQVIQKFYTPVNLHQPERRIDPSTVKWWMTQSDAAREVFKAKGVSLAETLEQFATWVGDDMKDVYVWGNGASFDNAILADAYKRCQIAAPWNFWNDRCYRTLKNLYPAIPAGERTGVYHNALADAEYQAWHAIKLLRKHEGHDA